MLHLKTRSTTIVHRLVWMCLNSVSMLVYRIVAWVCLDTPAITRCMLQSAGRCIWLKVRWVWASGPDELLNSTFSYFTAYYIHSWIHSDFDTRKYASYFSLYPLGIREKSKNFCFN